MFDAWLVWIIVGLLLSLGELLGAQFIFLAIGVSCLSGAAVAGFTDYGFKMQLGVTVAVSLLLIPLFVKVFQKCFKASGRATIGEGAEQLQSYEIVQQQSRLGVVIQGNFFPVKAEQGVTLQQGMQVNVLKMDGITAVVALAN